MKDDSVYLVGGLGMIVGAFFFAAKAIGGLCSLVFILGTTDFSAMNPTIGGQLKSTILSTHISTSVQGIASFLILFLGGRWILSRPALIEKWRGLPS